MESTQQIIAKIGKVAVGLLGVLTLFFGIKTVQSLIHFDNTPSEHTITVTGHGEAMAVPDVAQISFTVRAESKTMADAQKIVTDKIASSLDMLRGLSIEEKDIKTEYYSSYPKYEYKSSAIRCVDCPPYNPGNPIIVGYEVSQSVTVKVRDTEKVSAVLDGLAKNSVSEISGPNYTIDDEDSIKADARALAITDAKEKARVLARQLGVGLGKIVSFEEGSGSYPVYYEKAVMNAAEDSAAGAPAPELPKGENKIESNVTITFKIR